MALESVLDAEGLMEEVGNALSRGEGRSISGLVTGEYIALPTPAEPCGKAVAERDSPVLEGAGDENPE